MNHNAISRKTARRRMERIKPSRWLLAGIVVLLLIGKAASRGEMQGFFRGGLGYANGLSDAGSAVEEYYSNQGGSASRIDVPVVGRWGQRVGALGGVGRWGQLCKLEIRS